MEDLGQLRAQYYVFKSSGLFARGNRLLQLYDQGVVFLTPALPKAKDKERESFPFSEQFDISSPDPNGKDVSVRTKRQNFSLVSDSRERLLTDLCYYKDIYDAKYNVPGPQKGGQFEGFRQLVVSDIYTKIPVTMRVMRSAFHITYDKDAYKALYASPESQEEAKLNPRSYAIRYSDVTNVVVLPTGFLIEARQESERMVFDGDSINTIVELLNTLPEQSLGRAIPLQNELILKTNFMSDEDDFAVPMRVKLPGGLEREAQIHVSDLTVGLPPVLILEDSKSRTPVRAIDLPSILFISVDYHRKKKSSLVVSTVYRNKAKFRLDPHELDCVLASILGAGEQSETTPVLLLPPVDEALKIFGFDADTSGVCGQSLVLELEEAAGVGKSFDPALHRLLVTLALNAGAKVPGYDLKLLDVLTGLLKEYFTVVAKAESEADPETGRVKEYDVFIDLPKAERAKHDSGISPHHNRILLESSLYNAYSRMAPLLCCMRSLFGMRNAPADLDMYQGLSEVLLKVARCKNSLVAYLAASCVRSMLKLGRNGEKRLETVGKKWVVRELDLISKLETEVNELLKQRKEDVDIARDENRLIPAPYLHMYGLLSIFDSILSDKGLQTEDAKYVAETMFAGKGGVLDTIESLMTYHSAPILYQASKIQHEALVVAPEKEQGQDLLLHTTALLVRHLTLAMASGSAKQREMSARCATMQVVGNRAGCKLMGRIFPKSMLAKANSEAKCVDWKPEAWKDFFDVLNINYNTGTEQWNQDCREELIAKLKADTTKYMNAKRASGNGLKWNVEEFRVVYSTLENKCPVGRFYLMSLVDWVKEGTVKIGDEITDPAAFWKKLVKKYLVTDNVEQKKLILAVMRAVYRGYAEKIGEMKMLPYFVHLLADRRDRALHLLLLRLISSAVKVQNKELLFANYQLIGKEGGIKCIVGVLAAAFSVKGKSGAVPKHVRRCRLVFKIMCLILAGIDNKSIYPESKIVQECREPDQFRAIVHTISHPDESLKKSAVAFIAEHLVSPTLDCKASGLVDFLVASLEGPAAKDAFMLLCKLQELYKEYNAGLDTSKMIEADKEIVTTNERVQQSIFLRFLPVPFVRTIMKDFNYERSYEIFAADNARQPELVWDKDMRGLMLREVRGHVEKYVKTLQEFASKRIESIEDMPRYPEPFGKVIVYPQLSGEMRSGEYYLNTPEVKGRVEDLNSNSLVESLEKTLSEIMSNSEHIDFAKLDIVLGSFKIAFRGY